MESFKEDLWCSVDCDGDRIIGPRTPIPSELKLVPLRLGLGLLAGCAGLVFTLTLVLVACLLALLGIAGALLALLGARLAAGLLALLLLLSGETEVLDDSAAETNHDNSGGENQNRPQPADACHKSFDHQCLQHSIEGPRSILLPLRIYKFELGLHLPVV